MLINLIIGLAHESYFNYFLPRRGSQGASRAAPGKSGLHARGEGAQGTSIRQWVLAASQPAPELVLDEQRLPAS